MRIGNNVGCGHGPNGAGKLRERYVNYRGYDRLQRNLDFGVGNLKCLVTVTPQYSVVCTEYAGEREGLRPFLRTVWLQPKWSQGK